MDKSAIRGNKYGVVDRSVIDLIELIQEEIGYRRENLDSAINARRGLLSHEEIRKEIQELIDAGKEYLKQS